LLKEGGIMQQDESAARFLSRLESGEESALNEVYVRFADRLLALAEQEIGQRLRRHYSPEDALMSGIGSFCIRAAAGRYQFDHMGALWKLLRTFTLNKIRRAAGRHRREFEVAVEVDGDCQGLDKMTEEPTPGDVAEHADELEAFFSKFSQRDEKICRLWFEEYSSVEIANQVGCSKATVDRVRRRLRRLVREKLDRESEE